MQPGVAKPDPVEEGLGLVALAVGALDAQDVRKLFLGVGGREDLPRELGFQGLDLKKRLRVFPKGLLKNLVCIEGDRVFVAILANEKLDRECR